ncbi:uncharacterized protein BDZ99DRAFT_460870 [Mytilinidion resinicola]|uniref:Early meiotic induction protein 1 n=1 Tax=Mytilinidion resinicola TaxID=574789 RepID=A0A6A6YTF7_9PEZI|nr:uncharacterized protein BDZ99DRAFT_460870 [Mytilinidion resinicola]KAF2812090.1 hypothetical protein BDZ99DRAFT_460870 [Mytilinidion resinicola]
MGWLWSSTPSQPPLPAQLPSTSPPPPAPASPKPRALTRDEQADAELRAFLAELSAETSPSNPTTTTSPNPSQTPGALSKLKFHPSPSDGSAPLDPAHDESLYPSSMSCSAAFDSAFYCQSLGGKFNDIYRYGELRSCSEHWAQFWFCMRSKSLGEAERRRAVQAHYRQKAARVKAGKSSEDVWEVRRAPVVGAFSEAIDAA